MYIAKIPEWLLLTVSNLACVSASLSSAYYSKKEVKKDSTLWRFVAASSLISALFVLLASLDSLAFSWFSVLYGVAFGSIVVLYSVLYALACKTGPASYSFVIINLSTVITALSGSLFWKENFTISAGIGLILLVVCFFLSADSSPDDKKANLRWMLLTTLAMLACAGIGLGQKIHQESPHRDELAVMLISSFIVGSLISFAVYFFLKKKEGNAAHIASAGKNKTGIRRFIGCCLLMGAGNGLNHVFNLYLSGVMPSAVFFPLVNGIPLILVVFSSFILFRERLAKKQWFGLAVGIAACMALCFNV